MSRVLELCRVYQQSAKLRQKGPSRAVVKCLCVQMRWLRRIPPRTLRGQVNYVIVFVRYRETLVCVVVLRPSMLTID
jgi:hypothetical protein